MHVVWARHHNRLARDLAAINPTWEDDRLYEEARRILGAQMQHITYAEFLPSVLGQEAMQANDLNLGSYAGYDPTIDASIANEFATAAFRFAHSLIPPLVHRLKNDTSSEEFVQMRRMLFDPYALREPGALDEALGSAIRSPTQAADAYFSDVLKTDLFAEDGELEERRAKTPMGAPSPCGIDLVSLNVQRGRDHGLAPYVEWREACNLTRPKSFDDLVEDGADAQAVEAMRSLYLSVDDVDLYTGAMSEKPAQGSIVGPTATCIIGDQFRRLRLGDRFWYERETGPQAFTQTQLNEIRRTTLAAVLCANGDNLQQVVPQVMRARGPGNEYVSCDSLPQIDLSKWRVPAV